MSKIAIIGTVGLPANYGGFETLVENLVDKNLGHQITVYSSSKNYDKKINDYKDASLVYIPLSANGIESIFYDIASLIHALFSKPDTILILGVSGCIFLPVFNFISKAKIVTNIDGLEWKREKWGKWAKRYLKFSERLAVKYSDIVISDNQAIADYVKKEYNIKSEVIAYGGDHVIVDDLSLFDEGYALALCRIEPENNVELILESFSKVEKKLKFIGNWENSDFGRTMRDKYVGFNNIEFINPIYNLEILFDLRRKCSFYVHGHSAGGTNPSLVEMMHFGIAIFAFDCSYNRSSTENKAQYFLDSNELVQLISFPVSSENAISMKKIAECRYTWEIVKQQYFDLFK